jgi:hypothetical protein
MVTLGGAQGWDDARLWRFFLRRLTMRTLERFAKATGTRLRIRFEPVGGAAK